MRPGICPEILPGVPSGMRGRTASGAGLTPRRVAPLGQSRGKARGEGRHSFAAAAGIVCLVAGLVAGLFGGQLFAPSAARAEAASDFELAGLAALEVRIFPNDPADPQQDSSLLSPSLLLQPEFRYAMNDGRDRLTFIPFLRYDSDDAERSHFDIREAHWILDRGDWDVTVGIGKVFWGVTEARHLVDIINQTDFVENPDGEEKLGQPMINVNFIGEYGTLGFFALPGFRERSFPARRARLRGSLPIAIGDPVFESDAGRHRVDYALRWSHTIDEWDIGLSIFGGTSREPRLVRGVDASGAPILTPHYDIIDQLALDLQYTAGNWLWKLEAITRGGQGRRFAAAVAGFEYSFFDALGSGIDVGALAEYLFDGRSAAAPPTAFDNDIFAGVRLALNNAGGTSILAGAIVDRKNGTTILSIEAKHRIGGNWSLEIEAQGLVGVSAGDPLKGVEKDDFLQIRLVRYF